ncbi:isochorismate synthase [Crocosphaera sp. UHCC 0190]|uniref:isochorismate synthase n=1 Tax=Crocosphaera sp. UHCC 0190 TaxID=3110246 RepID=UPI002B216434|nr:isochorismate synthase [Crocosphaera sp. UHCC 0190]MEA5508369.1 isochorismate synthase [Crocosphaera sp. UHCC 0190]
MSVTAPVIPNRANVGYDEHKLDQLLLACQASLDGTNKSVIISFSQIIESIDPLLVLSFLTEKQQSMTFTKPNELSFYWENRGKKESILGYGKTQSLCLNTPDRFTQSQTFIKDCLQKIIRLGEQNLAESSPHFFCGFTFFVKNHNSSFPFPSASLFLPKIQLIKRNNRCVLTFNILIDKQTNIKEIIQKINNQTKSIDQVNSSSQYLFNLTPSIHPQTKYQMSHDFQASVTSALNSIKANHFHKLVLAHALDLKSPTDFSLINCLNNLRISYPDCYVFALNNGQGNCFIGASPERLISIQNQQLVTDALAGSAPRGKTKKLDDDLGQNLLKSDKERREHQVVIDCITNRLLGLGLTPQISPLKLLKLSNIQHLWTPIYTQLSPEIHPLEIVAKLHPTPAVSGFPTEITCEEIRRYETFERGLYAAPLGWIDYQGNSEFVVGIRSALISGNHARLYAGAGIVEGSEPHKELAEIQLKFQALLKALS